MITLQGSVRAQHAYRAVLASLFWIRSRLYFSERHLSGFCCSLDILVHVTGKQDTELSCDTRVSGMARFQRKIIEIILNILYGFRLHRCLFNWPRANESDD
jgi:hypothetical protein